MARKKDRPDTKPVLFDLVYEDGSLSSNRKVPASAFNPFDGDDPAKPFLEAQDRKIAELSGKPALSIKTIVRSARQ